MKRSAPLRWLDHIPAIPLAVGAVFLSLAPLVPEPHLWEKLKMLASGNLTRSLDIFDFFMHASLLVLLVLKLLRMSTLEKAKGRSASP